MSCSDEYISHMAKDNLIQITSQVKSKLQKAKYGVYNHSAVELCHWTKKSFANEGNCYKHKFYGISTHQCMEMTPTAMNCENRCVYCWSFYCWNILVLFYTTEISVQDKPQYMLHLHNKNPNQQLP